MTNLTIPNDPNIVLPPSVRAIIANADAYYQDENPEAAEATADDNTVDTSAAQPAPTAQVEPQSSSETKVNLTSESNDDDQTWEHKYKSMKGRYDRSQDQIRAMSEQIQSMQNVMATMQMERNTPANLPDDAGSQRLITEDEERDYGQDFLKVVGKKAKEEFNVEVSGLRNELAELKAKMQGVNGYVAQNERQTMLRQMDERLPVWRDINVADEFKDWLALPDPYSGAIRHDMLKAAYAENNTPRVLAFFDGFLAEEAALAPSGARQDTTGQQPSPGKVSLETLAAPGRAKTAAGSTAPAEKPFFTRAQIAAFYADCSTGKYRGKDAEKDKLEKQIFEAQQDGRIR